MVKTKFKFISEVIVSIRENMNDIIYNQHEHPLHHIFNTEALYLDDVQHGFISFVAPKYSEIKITKPLAAKVNKWLQTIIEGEFSTYIAQYYFKN
jgi:hypothetical protein